MHAAASAMTPNSVRVMSLSLHAQVGEIRVATDARPERNSPATRPELEIVHDEARLRGVIHIESRLGACDFDAHVRPRARFDVDVGLVDARALLTQPIPR